MEQVTDNTRTHTEAAHPNHFSGPIHITFPASDEGIRRDVLNKVSQQILLGLHQNTPYIPDTKAWSAKSKRNYICPTVA